MTEIKFPGMNDAEECGISIAFDEEGQVNVNLNDVSGEQIFGAIEALEKILIDVTDIDPVAFLMTMDQIKISVAEECFMEDAGGDIKN